VARIAAFDILSPGPLTTVQDGGRYGLGRYGVPPSGALDTFSLRIANLLVGNPEHEAGLEITIMGLKLRVLTDLMIAVTGADLNPHLNGKSLRMWCAHPMKKDDVLHFKTLGSGCRAYLTVRGGISIDPVLASKSTNLISGFGGYEGSALRPGDRLYTDPPGARIKAGERVLDLNSIPQYSKHWMMRVLLGPQDDDFTEDSKTLFLESPYTVSPESDRTGTRLGGPAVRRKPGVKESIISEGVVGGSIQIPGDGQPIIILVETVTGGYRKIATVISADLPLLGQTKPGDTIRFRAISFEEAIAALKRVEAIIATLKEPVP
jgi:antagonist of KipI